MAADLDGIAIEIRKLSKSFGAFQVLDDIDLLVRKGEKVVICGPSGSGKSTLIRCINLLEVHQGGTITVNGQKLPKDRKDNVPGVGMVFQQFNLFPHLSVLDNCTLALRIVHKAERKAAEDIAMHYLSQVRIPDQAKKYPAQLSGGQQQRVAIARALCLKPEIMLFDEPTSSLDPEMVKEVLDTMIGLAEGGMTMLVVTHEMSFARRVADHIVFMDAGNIIENQSSIDFFKNTRNERVKLFLQQILH